MLRLSIEELKVKAFPCKNISTFPTFLTCSIYQDKWAIIILLDQNIFFVSEQNILLIISSLLIALCANYT